MLTCGRDRELCRSLHAGCKFSTHHAGSLQVMRLSSSFDDMSAYGKEPSDAVHDSTISDIFAKTLSEPGIAYVAFMLARAF
jgi:hypothetical protein